MFGDTISFVVGPLVPVDLELFSEDAIFHPVKAYVPGFGVFLTDGGFEKMDVVLFSFLVGVGPCGCPNS